jgi:hypothetical protein
MGKHHSILLLHHSPGPTSFLLPLGGNSFPDILSHDILSQLLSIEEEFVVFPISASSSRGTLTSPSGERDHDA